MATEVPTRNRPLPPIARRTPAPSSAETLPGQQPLPGRAVPARTADQSAAAILRWLRAHALSLAIGGGMAALAGFVLATGAAGFPGLSDDEGTYVAQAWSVLTQGSLAHYTYWYDHPPLGWIQLAGLSWLFGPFTSGATAVAAARTLMTVPAVASYLLLFLLARRLGMRRAFAALAVALFAFSPLSLSFLRQVYLDNFATPWVLAAFVLAASPQRRLWAFAGSGACMAIAALSKETSLLVLPGLVLQVIQGMDRRTRAFSFAAFASVLVLVGLGYPLFALLKGELLPGHGHVSLFDAIRFQLFTRASSGTALQAHSLSRKLVDSWLSQDPILLIAGAATTVPALFVRRLRPAAVAMLFLFLGVVRSGYLPAPFVIALLPFCALLAAGVLDAAAGVVLRARRVPRPLAVAVVAAIVVALAAIVVPRWKTSDSYAMTTNNNYALAPAEKWIDSHVSPRARILVDDTLYVDLVKHGFTPRYGVVWFLKLDFTTNLDPSITRHLPQGWRAFQYVVSTPVIRTTMANSPTGMPQIRQALTNSHVVAAFGRGYNRIEVRRISVPHAPRIPHAKRVPHAPRGHS